MWIGIILGVIALLIIGNWIYTTINTKNIVEYHPNGKTKLKGVSKFNKRIGVFEMFDEEGNLTSKINYDEGKIVREDFYNPSTGKLWRTAFQGKLWRTAFHNHEIEMEYPKDYYYIFQVNSKNYPTEEEFRDKIKHHIDNYFTNRSEFCNLKTEDLTDVENGIRYEGDDITYSGTNRILFYDLTDYPSAEKHYEKVIQSLEEIKSENLLDDCSIIVRLSYTMMPF